MPFDKIQSEIQKGRLKKNPCKTYYFFCCGEFITAVDARTDEQAAELFKEEGYTKRAVDWVCYYNRSNGSYKSTNSIWRYLWLR